MMNKKILIINVNWIGDVLFSTAFIHAVRQAYPDSYIVSLVHPRCKDVLESNPRVNEIILYDEQGKHKSFIGKARLALALRARNFDIVFLLHRSVTKAFLAFLSGAKERIGYAAKGLAAIFLTKVVEPSGERSHKIEYFLDIARAIGIKPADVSYEFFVTDDDRRYVTGLLRNNNIMDDDTVIVICPAGNWPPKRWPRENFARLADELAESPGVKIILSAGSKDISLIQDIKSVMSAPSLITAGMTDLKQLGALLERADLVISNDTGPMHMSVAVGSKTIALFGPTSEEMTGPYGKGDYKVIRRSLKCETPCYNMSCTKYDCMDAIKVEDVLREAKAMLEHK